MTTIHEAFAQARVERFAVALREAMPRFRRLAPHMPEEELIEIASRLVEDQLIDVDRGPHRENR